MDGEFAVVFQKGNEIGFTGLITYLWWKDLSLMLTYNLKKIIDAKRTWFEQWEIYNDGESL